MSNDNNDNNDDNDDNSEVCSLDFSSDVQLGFIPNINDNKNKNKYNDSNVNTNSNDTIEQNVLFHYPIWSDWDGGKMGGIPVSSFEYIYIYNIYNIYNIV